MFGLNLTTPETCKRDYSLPAFRSHPKKCLVVASDILEKPLRMA